DIGQTLFTFDLCAIPQSLAPPEFFPPNDVNNLELGCPPYSQQANGTVAPACWFGEINIDFDKILRQLARKAAAGDHGLRISPLINNDRKGGAFPIMLHQFRRAIGVAIVRGNAQHKLGRLHYVRATPEEAADACRANHSSNRWNSQRHGQSNWFSQHTPDGYDTYEQFRNGYDHCVP
ncbi:hypothetical protein THAOC_28430, partial [Thalassiosira oceanica]